MSYKTISTDQAFSDNYKLLIGSILPRPIAVVGTKNVDGSFNLAPFSFFTGVSAKPFIVAFCPMVRTKDSSRKDTLINIEREKEFTINFCNEANYEKINMASTELPYGESEFSFAGLNALPSQTIKAPRLQESPIQFECILRDILSYGKEAGSGSLVTGEVKLIHVDPTIYKEDKIVTSLFKPVGRGAGNDWFKTDSVFELERLMKVQIQK